MLHQIGVVLLYIPFILGYIVGYGRKIFILVWAAIQEGYETGSKI